MSFADKFSSILARPDQDPAGADAPWYMKYGVRVLGIVAGFFAILFGLFNAVFIVFLDVSSFLSGTLQMIAGFLVIAIEVPVLVSCIDNVKALAEKADKRPLWNRAALYCLISLPPVIISLSVGSLFGCGLIFATGAVYGMMSLGKKASAEEMRQAAVNAGLANTPTTNDRASIVNNAQPFSFTGTVGTDSNV